MILFRLINLLFDLFELAIIIRVIISWVRPDVTDRRIIKALRILYQITEPILAPAREVIGRYLPRELGVDISPLIVLLLLPLAKRIVLLILSIFI